jgi:hypothetical protein
MIFWIIPPFAALRKDGGITKSAFSLTEGTPSIIKESSREFFSIGGERGEPFVRLEAHEAE